MSSFAHAATVWMPEQTDDPWKLRICHMLPLYHGHDHPGTLFLLPDLLLPLAHPFGEVPNFRAGDVKLQIVYVRISQERHKSKN